MTEIEIETYSSDDYSEDNDNFEYSYILITPDDSIEKENKEKNTNESTKKSVHHHSHHKSHQYKDINHNKNSSFSKFIARQNAANKRQIKNRDNPPTERRFNPPPFKFILQSAIPPPKIDSPTNQKQHSDQCSSLFQRSINQTASFSNNYYCRSPKKNIYDDISSFIEGNDFLDLNFMNDTSNNFAEDESIISTNSEIIADEKSFKIISNTCGNQKVLNLFKLKQILSRFQIKDQLLIDEICSKTKIDEQSASDESLNEVHKSIFGDRIAQSNDTILYDNSILKKLLIKSILEDINELSSFEIKIRNCISWSLRNDRYLVKKRKL